MRRPSFPSVRKGSKNKDGEDKERQRKGVGKISKTRNQIRKGKSGTTDVSVVYVGISRKVETSKRVEISLVDLEETRRKDPRR